MTTDAATVADRDFAARLRGFGPVGILAIVIVLSGNALFIPGAALLVLLWVALSHTPWSAIGYTRPKSWVLTVAIGIVFGAAFKLVMKTIVMPLLGADPINHAYHYLAGNRAMLPLAIYAMVIGAGFGEETVFRGFMFERFGRALGSSVAAKIAVVLITSMWFGVAHYSTQGLAGAEQAAIVGLVFGTIYTVTRTIWMLMIAHATFDLTALAIIYWDVESRVAHLVFK